MICAFDVRVHQRRVFCQTVIVNVKKSVIDKTPHYSIDLDITHLGCGSQIPWNFTKELQENDHDMVIFL